MRRYFAILTALILATTTLVFAATTSFAPTGDVTVTNWTALGGGTKFSEIDESPGNTGANDGDTSYIESATNNNANRLSITNPAIPDGSTINSVQLLVVAKEIGGDTSIRMRIYVNGVSQVCGGLSDQLALTYDVYGDGTPTLCTWTTNPVTAVAWTEADIEGTSAAPLNGLGFSSTDITAGESVRVTQAFLIVDYTAPAGGGGAGHTKLTLLGVGGD